MLDWTDCHFRFLLRLCAPNARLYTEMVTTGALLFGDKDRHLRYSSEEHPLALQLGGSDPQALAECAKLAASYHYDEINLNIGCPSDRVQSGQFGACLMKNATLVAQCVRAMKDVVEIPITIKTRIGVDECDSQAFLEDFVGTTNEAGCDVFIIHARKAWLKGLSPKENREIPPLCYPTVYALKKKFPDCTIVVNGGIATREGIQKHLSQGLDGVMIGREAYRNTYNMVLLHDALYGAGSEKKDIVEPEEIMQQFLPYIASQLSKGERLHRITRHTLNLFNGKPNAKLFRRYLSQHAYLPGAGVEVVQHGLQLKKSNHPTSCSPTFFSNAHNQANHFYTADTPHPE